jgi:hypothetical protein
MADISEMTQEIGDLMRSSTAFNDKEKYQIELNNEEFLKKRYLECLVRLDREKSESAEHNPNSRDIMDSRKKLTDAWVLEKTGSAHETIEGIGELDLSEQGLCVFEETQGFKPSNLC